LKKKSRREPKQLAVGKVLKTKNKIEKLNGSGSTERKKKRRRKSKDFLKNIAKLLLQKKKWKLWK
jgi:hypothetical protein